MDRKQILKVLEERLGVKAKYMGAPSFSYQIEFGSEIFTMDRDGKVTDFKGKEVQIDSLINQASTSEEVPLKEDAEIRNLEITVPMKGHSGVSLRNLINMIYSKQKLIKKVIEINEDIIDERFVLRVNERRIQSQKDFEIALNTLNKERCRVIEFDFAIGTITFKLLNAGVEDEKVDAITKFVALLNKSAMEQKHTSFKVSDTDNEKFTFRTWLLRLGFIGDDYKSARKYLLKNLHGNGAFRRVRRTEEAESI